MSHDLEFAADTVIEKLLFRLAISAAALLPVAHLSSLGIMEASGFVLMVASAGLFILEARANSATAVSRIRCGAAVPIAGYAVVTLLSIGMMLDQANDQIDALRELKWVLYFFAFLYFFNRYWSDAWARYIVVLSAAVALMGLFGVFQFVFGWEWPRSESVLEPWGRYFRVTGFFNTPQSFAGNLGMATFFLLGITLAKFSGALRVAEKPPLHLLISVGVGLLGVLLTLTRSAWLGGAITAVLALGRVKKSWGVITVLIFLFLTSLSLSSGSTFSERLSSDVEVNSKSIEIRQELWGAHWRMFQDSPYLGTGPGKNLKQLEEYYAAVTVEHGVIDRAHNNILEHLAGQGIFVAGLYLIFSGYFLWAAYWLSAHQNLGVFVTGVGVGSLLAQIYFHFLGLVDSNFFDQEVKNVLVWLWALTAAVYQRKKAVSP